MSPLPALRGRRPALVVLAIVLGLLGLGLLQALDVVPLDGPVGDAFRRWGIGVVLPAVAVAVCSARVLLHRPERFSWAIIAVGTALWTGGNAYYAGPLWDATSVPIPSPADAFFLALYPFLYAGVLRLVAGRVRGFSRDVALDALMAALVVGAVAAALVFQPVLSNLEGTAAEQAFAVAYPVLDLVLLATAAVALALGGWRPGRSWIVLIVGFVVFAVGDSVYLVQNVQGTWEQGTAWEGSWPLAITLMAAAAWLPPRRVAPIDTTATRVAVIPLVLALMAVALLVIDRALRLNAGVTGLSTAALLVVIARLAVTFAENGRLLEASRHEAETDHLTGLAARRKLLDDLAAASEAAPQSPAVLVLLDLNGFKAYNDREGHVAGDELLARLARRLDAAMGTRGRAYRMGGDEFCVLATDADPAAVRAAAVGALTLVEEGATVTTAAGVALLPDEAADPRHALQLADERMYADKRAGRQRRPQASLDDLEVRSPDVLGAR